MVKENCHNGETAPRFPRVCLSELEIISIAEQPDFVNTISPALTESLKKALDTLDHIPSLKIQRKDDIGFQVVQLLA